MNYSEQQTKLETPAFFFTFISRLFMPSRSGEHLFVGLWHDTKERGICQIKSYKRPFRPRQLLERRGEGDS